MSSRKFPTAPPLLPSFPGVQTPTAQTTRSKTAYLRRSYPLSRVAPTVLGTSAARNEGWSPNAGVGEGPRRVRSGASMKSPPPSLHAYKCSNPDGTDANDSGKPECSESILVSGPTPPAGLGGAEGPGPSGVVARLLLTFVSATLELARDRVATAGESLGPDRESRRPCDRAGPSSGRVVSAGSVGVPLRVPLGSRFPSGPPLRRIPWGGGLGPRK